MDELLPRSAAGPALRRRAGFTLVEMLVVIGVIAILLGILLTGLRSAIGAGGKTRELSALRQVFLGWTMYSSSNEEQLLPGFVDVNTQTKWNVDFRDAFGEKLPLEESQAWPWRLASYVDKSWDVLVGYRDDYDEELTAVPAEVVANEPSFGYNAYYVGGWWTAPTATSQPTRAFDNYVARTAGSIVRPDTQAIFCASTLRGPGYFKSNDDDLLPGAHWVSPPTRAQTLFWRPATGSASDIDVVTATATPLPRFSKSIAMVTGDGGAQAISIQELFDMRRWVNAADKKDWNHPPD